MPTTYRKSTTRLLLLMILSASAIAQENDEGEIKTAGASGEGIIETIGRGPDHVHVGIGPTAGIIYNLDGAFLDRLRELNADADLEPLTIVAGFGAGVRIDRVVAGLELGAYHIRGANSTTATTSIGRVDYTRTARLEIRETGGRIFYNIATSGSSLLYAGFGLGGGSYLLELIQAPRSGSGDPFIDTAFTTRNPDYRDRRLRATWLVLTPELQYQLFFASMPYLRLQADVGLRALFDVGPWREEGRVESGLPRNGSVGVVAGVGVWLGLF